MNKRPLASKGAFNFYKTAISACFKLNYLDKNTGPQFLPVGTREPLAFSAP
jgi:hypothetical protein